MGPQCGLRLGQKAFLTLSNNNSVRHYYGAPTVFGVAPAIVKWAHYVPPSPSNNNLPVMFNEVGFGEGICGEVRRVGN